MDKIIKYFSTNCNAPSVSFKEALLKGQAPDRGLYMPNILPEISLEEINEFSKKEYYEIAFDIARRFLSNEISENDLNEIVKDAYNFSVPLENVYEKKYIMRLDQGPTASFKDFAARMMGRMMQHFLKKENRELLILTATSGDTGSAIANAFYGLENIRVVILYPEKEVSARQRKQMTTLKKNIKIIALNGKFDDCQALVKKAFSDSDLDPLNLSSANSINIGRLLPQTMYYFYSFAKLTSGNREEKIIFSVPSGNFGDLMGGLIAKKMGLPVKKFIVSTNENDEVPLFFSNQRYKKIAPSKNCISSAMNVGHPSNLARLVGLYDGNMDEKGNIKKMPDMESIARDMYAISISDEETKQRIESAYKEYQLLLEPHGAVGWAGLCDYLEKNPQDNNAEQICVVLETAHPAKFPETINEILSIDPSIPKSLEGLEDMEEEFSYMENSYEDFKDYLKKL